MGREKRHILILNYFEKARINFSKLRSIHLQTLISNNNLLEGKWRLGRSVNFIVQLLLKRTQFQVL